MTIYEILPALGLTQSVHEPSSECTGAQILNFQNTFDRPCDEIRIEIQTENLQKRRTNTKMVIMYRIVHHLIAIPSQMFLTPATTRTTRGHYQKFQIPFSRIQSHRRKALNHILLHFNNNF
jgi:hypothetical protein